MDQHVVDLMDVIDLMEDRRHEHDVAGQQPEERRHPIQDQRFLYLIQIELRREADAEDDVSLDRMLFLGDDLVAVVFGNVGGEENVLLQHPFVSEFGPHVLRERPWPGQQIFHADPQKDRQVTHWNRYDLLIQLFFRFPNCFVQLFHPFYS